jgi:hypothetical protein
VCRLRRSIAASKFHLVCRLGVNRVDFAVIALCPVHPQHQIFLRRFGPLASGQSQTRALQKKSRARDIGPTTAAIVAQSALASVVLVMSQPVALASLIVAWNAMTSSSVQLRALTQRGLAEHLGVY